MGEVLAHCVSGDELHKKQMNNGELGGGGVAWSPPLGSRSASVPAFSISLQPACVGTYEPNKLISHSCFWSWPL